jgi:hypothetical protein
MATAVQSYQLTVSEDRELSAFATRIKSMMRGGEKMTPADALSLAQFSKVTGLSPFVGECWWIPGSGAMVGIAGARRLDQERTASNGGYSWPIVTPCPPDEAGAPESELKDVVAAFKVEINDSAATRDYQKMFAETIQTMREAGSPDPFAAAKEICGPRPVWTGYGYSKKSEQSRMNKTQLARKRAEADALKKRIILPFGARVAETDAAPDYVDAQLEDIAPKRTQAQNMKELGFESGPEIPAVDPEKEYQDAAARTVKIQTKNGTKEIPLGDMTVEQLNYVIKHSLVMASAEAAKVVLKHDHNMDPEGDEPSAPAEQGQLI